MREGPNVERHRGLTTILVKALAPPTVPKPKYIL
jgi:hypothetical protein